MEIIVKKKLEKEIADKSIICLQELSIAWNSNLHTFFSQNKYILITGMYGKKFNGYMGVGIAVPYEKYDIVATDIM